MGTGRASLASFTDLGTQLFPYVLSVVSFFLTFFSFKNKTLSHLLSDLMLKTILLGKYYYYPNDTDTSRKRGSAGFSDLLKVTLPVSGRAGAGS